MRRLSDLLLVVAGLMGAAGVGLAAWAAHRSGGDTLMTAALFLIIHATAVAAIALLAAGRGLLVGGALLALGAILFTGDLALRFTINVKLWAMAAPTGGVVMILGWLWLGGVGAIRLLRGREG